MKGLTVTLGVIILAQMRDCATVLPFSDFETYVQSTESKVWSSRSLLQQGICPETEYYCGPGDAFEKEVHDALNQPSNCSYDQDIQLWFCGDFVITDSAYQLHKKYNATCLAACVDSSAALSLPTQYYWAVTDWGTCSATCDGGVQTRTVSCMNSIDGSQAGNLLCPASSQPGNRQPCNEFACEVLGRKLQLSFTAWGECGAACGVGYNDRTAICANVDGIPVDVSACSSYTGPQLSGSCQEPSCSQAHFQLGAWSPCNATCGGGVETRSVACVDAKRQPAPASACLGLTAPAAVRACNTAPCVGHTWQVGRWGNCSQACGGGIRERGVQCVTQFLQPAPDSASCVGLQPADQLQCNVLPCNFCSQTNCAGQGVCKGGVCVCQPGYRGSYCEIPPACSGILDQDGNCCATGIVSQNGTCCAQGAVLDRHSACCAGGTLDACGACGGSARAVDVQNVCCSSGELDGDGYCCQSGLVDECGVCDGQSTACALSAVLDVQVSQAASYLSLGTYAFATTMEGFVSSTLAINASHIQISDLVVEPGTTISQSSASVKLRVALTATPAASGSAPMDLRAAQATRQLQDAIGQTSGNQLLVLQDVPRVQRTAVCGNQVCEPGERTIAGPNNLGCPGDCAFPLVACPAPAGGDPCSDHGWCASAFGVCQCWFGYTGDDCSQCAEGYIRSGSVCTRYVRANLPLLDLSSKAGLDSVLGIGIALIVLALLLMCIMAIILIRMRRKAKGTRGKKGKGMASRESSIKTLQADASSRSLGASALNLVAHGLVAVERRAQKGRAGSEELASVARSPASMRQVNAGVRPAIAALRASAPPAPGSTHSQSRPDFRIEDTAGRSGSAPTLEDAIRAEGGRESPSGVAARQQLDREGSGAALLGGRENGTSTAPQKTLSSAGSNQGPVSWPLLDDAKAKKSQALESALGKEGRVL